MVKHKVDKILTENREIQGVKVGGKIFRAPVVVSNADAKTTFLELVGENDLDSEFIGYIKEAKNVSFLLYGVLGCRYGPI